MRKIMIAVIPLVLCSLVVAVPSIWASWIQDGIPVCTEVGSQAYPEIIPDADGGAILTWDDCRTADWDIYVQRIDASGAALWTAEGVALCTATSEQSYPVVASRFVSPMSRFFPASRNSLLQL
jgi:hypothetical protein